MAWVSPRVYAILSKSEEGKDIIERLPDMTQDECQVELDRFFGEGGKGASSSKEYGQAKFDDEAEEEMYKAIGDEEVSEKDYEEEITDEEYKVGDEVEVQGKEYTITKIDENGNFEAEGKNGTFGRGNLKDKTGFGGNPISIKKINRMNNNVEASNHKLSEKMNVEEEPKIEKKYGYNRLHEDESKLTSKEAAALKYMYGTQITDEEMKSKTDDEIKRAVDYYDWTLSKYTDDERAYVINQEKKDFNIGKTVPAREKGFGWKKTKMASGVLYTGPNGEREMK